MEYICLPVLCGGKCRSSQHPPSQPLRSHPEQSSDHHSASSGCHAWSGRWSGSVDINTKYRLLWNTLSYSEDSSTYSWGLTWSCHWSGFVHADTKDKEHFRDGLIRAHWKSTTNEEAQFRFHRATKFIRVEHWRSVDAFIFYHLSVHHDSLADLKTHATHPLVHLGEIEQLVKISRWLLALSTQEIECGSQQQGLGQVAALSIVNFFGAQGYYAAIWFVLQALPGLLEWAVMLDCEWLHFNCKI